MKKTGLIKWLKEQIACLPQDYEKVYDTATIDEGIRDCLLCGRRDGYETVLLLMTGKKTNEEADNVRKSN